MQVLWLLFLAWQGCTQAYVLNVPRVLLPYHPSKQVTFLLEVSDPEGGCFTWRSTRPDVVSVDPIEPKQSGCSDRALLSARSKHPDEQSVTIFASDPDAGVTLSCGVTVDVIRSVKVETITSALFLEAPPARMMIDAFNDKGHAFSALGDIPFEWSFEFADAARRPLRIIPFHQSKYDAPAGIVALERLKKKGFVVLVEGIQTGSARLTAKFSEPHFDNIKPNTIELSVVANLLLIPSEDLYVPAGSVIPYSAVILKQGVTEPVPHDQYLLHVSDTSICSLDSTTNYVTANKPGSVEVLLFDATVAQKSSGTRPQSAHLYVVQPDSVYFTIDRGNNWVLQTGVDYVISVKVLDQQGNSLFIADNARFETDLGEHFAVLERSANGTHLKVTARRTGAARLRTRFTAFVDAAGETRPLAVPIVGEQKADVFAPLDLTPKTLIFPHHAGRPYQHRLKAAGGSGLFLWNTEQPRVAAVSEEGVLTSGALGETVVHVADYRNEAHQDMAKVIVIDPLSLEFGPSPLEAEVGQPLTLNLKLLAKLNGAPVPFTDCRQADFGVQLSNPSVFKWDKGASAAIPAENRGCATVTLLAQLEGQSTLTVRLSGQLSASVDVYAYAPLQLAQDADELLVALGSSAPIRFRGGPRPFPLDPTKHHTQLTVTPPDAAQVLDEGGHFRLQCAQHVAEAEVQVRVANRRSAALPQPAQATAQLRVCCALPTRILLQPRPQPPAHSRIPACPTQTRSIYFAQPTQLEVHAYGTCKPYTEEAIEKKFASISGLVVDFSVKQQKLAKVSEAKHSADQADIIVAELQPSGTAGHLDVQATAQAYRLHQQPSRKLPLPATLHSAMHLHLVDRVRVQPDALVLWNQRAAHAHVQLLGGSGHFHVDQRAPTASLQQQREHQSQLVSALLQPPAADQEPTTLRLTPLTEGQAQLDVHDLCIRAPPATIDLSVTEIGAIRVDGPAFVPLGQSVTLRILVHDLQNRPFSPHDIAHIPLQLGFNPDLVDARSTALLEYEVHGKEVGLTDFTVVAQSASGKTIQSQAHQLQVFAPLLLDPLEVTLLPESVFQLEVKGGPKTNVPVQFHLNNSLATVRADGLISTGRQLGVASVRATAGVGAASAQSNAVVLRVVSLAGVRIVLSSALLETGQLLDARVEGVAGAQESPFAFGAAHHQLQVDWWLAHAPTPAPLDFAPALEGLALEPAANRFHTRLRATRPGTAHLHVRLTPHPAAHAHLQSRAAHFTHQVEVQVRDPLHLDQPALPPTDSVRLTPMAKLMLAANRPEAEMTYRVAPSSAALLHIQRAETLDGARETVLEAGHAAGVGAVRLVHNHSLHNTSVYLTVEVVPAATLRLNLRGAAARLRTSLLPGTALHVDVQVLDHRSRVIHAVANKFHYRPNRFDLTEIVASDDRRQLKVYLRAEGETILRVWDPLNPHLSAFLRLPVAELSPEEAKDEADEDAALNHTGPIGVPNPLVSAQKVRAGIVNTLADFFDQYLGFTLFLIFTLFVATLVAAAYYVAVRRGRACGSPAALNSSGLYAYSRNADGSFGMSSPLAATAPLLASTPTEATSAAAVGASGRKPVKAAKKVFPTPRTTVTVNQSRPDLSAASAGSANDDLFNGSLSPNHRLGQVVNRYYK